MRWCVALPQRSVLGDNGRWAEGGVLPRFAALWQLAERFQKARDAAIAGAERSADGTLLASFDFQGVHEAAIAALAENYQIGPTEADLLGLLTFDISREILEAVIDLPTWIDWFKKKRSATEAAGTSTADGSKGAIPPTDQR